jgi:hypothetical protein
MSEPSGTAGDFAEFDDYAPAQRDAAPAAAAEAAELAGAAPVGDPGLRPDLDPVAVDETDVIADLPAEGASDVDDPTGTDEVAEAGRLERPVTGNARVDSATASLDLLDELPTPQHADVFDEVHRRLQGALADLDVG